jgi:hypothetical protein
MQEEVFRQDSDKLTKYSVLTKYCHYELLASADTTLAKARG